MIPAAEVFAADGLLAQALPDYRVRAQQIEMADAVTSAIEARQVLVVEAGTGTGKTYGYLVPALLSGGKVIVSTGTKTLQDQLFQKDIPAVRHALRVPSTVAILKGRANYICHYHLGRTALDGRLPSREDVHYLQLIKRAARASSTGDKAEVSGVPEQAAIWNFVTSTRDNCLGSDCPNHGECFVMKARKQALEADVVVVNHHLFFADVWLRDEGATELLPQCNTVIFDEAHQLPEVASVFFGDQVGVGQVLDFVRDTKVELAVSARDVPTLPPLVARLDKAARDLRLVFGAEPSRCAGDVAMAMPGFTDALRLLAGVMGDLVAALVALQERAEGLQRCVARGQELLKRLADWQGEDAEMVCWVEVFQHGLQLNRTPLSVAETFQRQLLGSPRAWIFTSATLAVDGDFSHYTEQMGMPDAASRCWGSPFNYKQQAVLYVPKGLPPANTPSYTQAMLEDVWPLVQAAAGHTFLLFTSLRAMREAYLWVKAKLEQAGLAYPVLVQGEGSRTELLERFRVTPHAVLVASQTFWEGVDVRGDQLRLVVIDKLPFAVPDDPVLAARIAHYRRAGRDPFIEYQLPHAAITLKQGAGRLIRDEQDRGVLVIADARLVEKGYGARIWRSLPDMSRTRDRDAVVRFLQRLATSPDAGSDPVPAASVGDTVASSKPDDRD